MGRDQARFANARLPATSDMTSKDYLAWVCVVGGVPLLLACGTKQPCRGVVEGASYTIEIGAENEPSIPASGCQDGWGFTEGLVFSATTYNLEGDGECLVGVPELAGVPGRDGVTDWTYTESNTEINGGGFMNGFYRAAWGGCNGVMSFELVESGAAFPCFQHGTGRVEACLMNLMFSPTSSGGCPASCNAFLATTVTRQ